MATCYTSRTSTSLVMPYYKKKSYGRKSYGSKKSYGYKKPYGGKRSYTGRPGMRHDMAMIGMEKKEKDVRACLITNYLSNTGVYAATTFLAGDC